MNVKRAVFLDKDGTLVEDIPYNVDPERISLASGVLEGLQALQAAGYRLVVITNQSGIARGYFPEAALMVVEKRLRDLLDQGGVSLDGFYYCPHLPDGLVPEYAVDCACRKPKPGLLVQAALYQKVDLDSSWLIGDILNDIEAGRRAGVRTVLIDNGNETEWILTPERQPHFRGATFIEATQAILEADGVAGVLKTGDLGFSR